MPANYAPFGNAIFGQTLFGVPPTVSAATTISVVPLGYNALEVNWIPVKGVLGQTLVRSSYGIPTSITDGVVLLNESNSSAYSAQFVDANLQSGRFYYYALFINFVEQATPQVTQELLAGSAQGLVLTDWGFGDIFQSWTPDFYMWADGNLATTAQPQGPLERFLNLLGYEMNWVRSEIETLTTLTSADYISGALLPDLGSTFGVTYEPELGMTRSRVLVKNAVALYKQRGTPGGISAAASAFSGYGAKVTIGKNLEIQLDDAAFDFSVGHWVPGNGGTTINIVPASTYNVTPPHIAYQPIQGNPTALALNTSLGLQGYLPDSNNENVAVITAGSAPAWTQVFPTTTPSARTLGWMTYFPPSSKMVLFGGLSNLSVNLNDTWTYQTSNNTWTLLAPATSPTPARIQHAMAYDSVTATLIMFGGSGSVNPGYYGDTWSWNGTTWTLQLPGSGPQGRSAHSMAFDTATGTVLLFGGRGFSGVPLTFSDTWSYNATTNIWTQLFPATSPPARYGASMAYDAASGTVILFGGAPSGGGPALNDTWSWNGTTWTQLFPTASPSPRGFAGLAYNTVNQNLVLFGGQNIIAGGFIGNPSYFGDTWSWNGTTWIQLAPILSPPISAPSMDYDQSANTVIAYFGSQTVNSVNQPIQLNSTWQFTVAVSAINLTTCNPSNAANLGIPVSPLDLSQATPTSVAYILSASFLPAPTATITLRSFRMQLDWYGVSGTLISSTVGAAATEVNGVWVRASVGGFPPPGAVTFGRTVRSTTTLTGDLHLMDAEQIEVSNQATPSPTPWEPPRDIKVNLFPLRQNKIPNPVGLSGTFGWNVAAGTFVPTSTAPATWPTGTSSGFLATTSGIGAFTLNQNAPYIPLEQISTVTSSASYTLSLYALPVTSSCTVLTQVSFFGPGASPQVNWTQLIPATNPTARSGHSMAYNSANSTILLFGGITNLAVNLNDTWSFNGSTWTQLAPAASPSVRFDAGMAYNAAASNWVLFGGVTSGVGTLGDTWTFNGTTWTQLFPATSPPARYGFGMVYDVNTSTVIIFGGQTGNGYLNDTWSWNGTTWTQLFPATSPPGRTFFNMVYESINTSIFLFGGANSTGYLNDTWSWNGTTWTQLFPATKPQARSSFVMVYDQSAGIVILFGGQKNAPVQDPNDTWIWNGITWAQVFPTLGPNARVDSAGVYDSSLGATILVNGHIFGVPSNFSDTWAATINNSLASYTSSVVCPPGVFTRASNINAVAPVGANEVQVQVSFSGDPANAQRYLTGFLLEPSPSLLPYFDANSTDFADYFWEGTPNQSPSDYYPALQIKLARLTAALPSYVPIGATFSLITGAQAFTNVGDVL